MKIDGKPIVNAVASMHVQVTPADIRNSKSKQPHKCAVAKACLRQFGVAKARVHLGVTYLDVGDFWIRYKTPSALRNELISFDRGGTFQPGNYELIALPPKHRPNGKRRGGLNPTPKEGQKRRKAHRVEGVRYRGNANNG